MAGLTRPIKPRSRDRSHAGISHERLARRRYAPCPRLWRLLFDPRSFRGTRRLANPEVSDGDVTLGWPWDAADRVFGPYDVIFFAIAFNITSCSFIIRSVSEAAYQQRAFTLSA